MRNVTALGWAALVCCGFSAIASAVPLAVTSTSPLNNALNVPILTPVVINFNQAVLPSTVNANSFWVMGKSTGTVSGSFSFSNGNQTVTFTPNRVLSAGESVLVVLSHDLTAADSSPLRAAGYSYLFWTRTRPAAMTYTTLQALSNVTGNCPAVSQDCPRLYGASAGDLDGDGYLDLTTVNEVSADLRVFVNLGANGPGQADDGMYGPMVLPPLPVGVEISPNDTGDFNHDGSIDLAVAASSEDNVGIALSNGNGTYVSPAQIVAVGGEPHGVAVLDVDGDGDLDVVNANRGSNNLSLMLNNGSGVFGVPTFFDGGVNGEYGLAAGDMNNDGILDLVVAGRDSATIRVLRGNGNGTFTQMAAQSTGGATWVTVLGDLNADGNLDATTANNGSGNGAVVMGNGDGTFDPPVIQNIGAHTVSTDLGDLDGDGDVDWVLSSFGGGFWRVFKNNGAGVFTLDEEFTADANPSCSIILDIDNDRDLDLALTDETAEQSGFPNITIVKNTGTAMLDDFDNDGNVNMFDYNSFVACYSGPGVDAGLACGHADFNGDGDIDCDDWTDFMSAWTAGGSPPALPQCVAGPPIPTVGQWGLVVMAVSLLGCGTVLLRRRETSAQTSSC